MTSRSTLEKQLANVCYSVQVVVSSHRSSDDTKQLAPKYEESQWPLVSDSTTLKWGYDSEQSRVAGSLQTNKK